MPCKRVCAPHVDGRKRACNPETGRCKLVPKVPLDTMFGVIGWSEEDKYAREVGAGAQSELYWMTKAEVNEFAKKKKPGKIDIGKPSDVKGKKLVVKVLLEDDNGNEARIQRHINECSPGLTPKIFWSGIFDKQRITVMEFIKYGVTLREYMKDHRFPQSRIDYALKRLKKCGVKHDDLHTENIMIVDDDIMIVDYGLSSMTRSIPGNTYNPEKNSNRTFLLNYLRAGLND